MPSGSCSLDCSFLYSLGKRDEKAELVPHCESGESRGAVQTAQLHHCLCCLPLAYPWASPIVCLCSLNVHTCTGVTTPRESAVSIS